ncbi:T9SS type A sorting domain-containing protein [Dawidia soli]|uniref:T9SS type A sorting domain-containing protein n=1 Tax=Dawidia soli TaxID=2782352 RepID=A0AAP2D9Q6_9BACT|nr:T9SS type A sorting domain-containing protein [Dawidia soli]MBT1687976.1 T9SS type A sorting domain-containing protein [Dawidia soli]
MKKLLLMVLVSLSGLSLLQAQPNLSIVSPSGLIEPPYEVPVGTEVTLRWSTPTQDAPLKFFSFAQEPDFGEWNFQPNPEWTSYNPPSTPNGDGSYDFKIKVDKPLYVWGGYSTGGGSGFLYWHYSPVYHLEIASGVTITAADGWVCPEVASTERLQITGTYASYQWYRDGEAIPNATSASYDADDPGQYKVQVPLNGNLVFSNSVRVREAAVAVTGVLAGSKLTMTATEGMTSYQWLSGTSEAALTPLGAATSRSQQVTVNAAKTYYAVRAVQAGCTVQSAARPASTAIFAAPVLTSNAEELENDNDVICLGASVRLTAGDKYAGYKWYSDGEFWYEGPNEIHVTETKTYYVEVSIPEWPEIWRASDTQDVFFFAPITPVLTGVAPYSSHCPGEPLSLTITDEGYPYTWTKHVFGHEPVTVTPEGFTYNFSFEGEMEIVVKAEALGCESTTRVYLQSYAGQQFPLALGNESIEYLCGGQTQEIYPYEDMRETHDHFQWYTVTNGVYKSLSGKTNQRITVNAAGTYVLRAHPIACDDANLYIESFPVEIRDGSSRALLVETDKNTLCEGEKATLSISGEWRNVQWFEKTIANSGPTGHHEVYVPLSGAGSTLTVQVTRFTTYQVRAHHESCTTGVKAVSAPIQIKPTVNPKLTVTPTMNIHRWVLAPYDSIADVIFCGNSDITVTAPAGYTSYRWFRGPYDGSGNYVLGEEVAGETTNKISYLPVVNWLTARVVDAHGCVGYSVPLLIDTYTHASPAVAEQGNGEFCAEGDSVWLANAFQGNWVRYEWYRDGELVPNSDNDTIWVKEPGGYNVTGFPEECPTIGYNSGTPARIRTMPAPHVIETDTAYLPGVEGFAGEIYDIRWFVDDELYTIPEGQQAFIYKGALPPGDHTLVVEITNPTACTRTSPPYSSAITGLEPGELAGKVRAYPNPTTGRITLHGLHPQEVQQVKVYNAQGIAVRHAAVAGEDGQLDLTASPAGVYIVDVVLKNGSSVKTRVVRQ